MFSAFWLMFDVTPLIALFWIHRTNFKAFDRQDLYMICEVTFQDTASEVSELIDPETFNDMLQTKQTSGQIALELTSSSSSDDEDSPNPMYKTRVKELPSNSV
jgi:hypothetical protein